MPNPSDYEPLNNDDGEPNSDVYDSRTVQKSKERMHNRKPSYFDPAKAADKPKPAKVKPSSNPITFVKVTDPQKFRGMNPVEGEDYEKTTEPEVISGVGENGEPIQYFNAVSMHPGTGKHQSFRVLILPEVPTSDIALLKSGVLSSDMNDYEYKGKNSGGGNYIGKYGGQYRFRYVTAKDLDNGKPNADMVRSKTILFKQDAHVKKDFRGNPKKDKDNNPIVRINNDKNIIEYAAGAMKNYYGGDSAATTFLASKPSEDGSKPGTDLSGANTYAASIFKGDEHQIAQDLFRDITRLNGGTPKPDDQRKRFAGSLNRTWFRNGLLDPETGKCRFHNFETCGGVALAVGDFDIHSGNLMVLAERDENGDFLIDPATGKIKCDAEGKIGILVNIDHAGSYRNLSDEVHMDKFRFFMGKMRGSNSGNFTMQPTNHHREIPRLMRVSEVYAAELDRMGKKDINLAYEEIDQILNNITSKLGVKPIMEFGRRMDCDVKGELRKLKDKSGQPIYKDNKVYERIKAGAYTVGNSPDNDQVVKEHVTEIIRKFWKAKTLARQQSMRELAVDMKVSLCIKKENGKFVLDPNSSFSLEKILLEHPDYITNNKFHFRGEGQKGFSAFMTSPFHKSILLDLAQQGSKTAALDTLRKSLGANVISQNNSNYSITFYRNENDRKATPPVPVGVYNIVVSAPVFKGSIYYDKFKKSAPTISTKAINTKTGLKPGEYSLNFIASETPGIKGLYIERYTENLEYQISAHRLPPELNTRYIFSNVLQTQINQDLLSADPGIDRTLRRISAKIQVTEMGLDRSKLSTADQEYLSEVLTGSKDFVGSRFEEIQTRDGKNLTDVLLAAYDNATTQLLEMHVADEEDVVIPSKAYLDFAEKQCQSMVLRNGKGTVIDILPDDRLNGDDHTYNVKNPLLAQAYMLVCSKNGWAFNNLTNVPTYDHQALNNYGAELRALDASNLAHPSKSVK